MYRLAQLWLLLLGLVGGAFFTWSMCTSGDFRNGFCNLCIGFGIGASTTALIAVTLASIMAIVEGKPPKKIPDDFRM